MKNSSEAMVLVTTSFPVASDGSEAAGSFVSDLAEELARDIRIRVVAPGQMSTRGERVRSMELFRFAAPSRPLSTLKPWKPGDLGVIRHVLNEGLQATRAAVHAGPVAHMLALWALPSGYWARRVAAESGLTYSVWTLGSDIWALGRIPFVRTYLRKVLRDARQCYSDGIKLAEDTRRIAMRDVEFLPSTRRIERRRDTQLRSKAPYRLLFLGRWHVNKGVDLLIDALKLLDEDDWQRIETVEICGGGPLDLLVRSSVRALQAIGRPVQCHGYLDKSAAEEKFLSADYFLIPSRIESIPLVFSDAMKLGCPVICMPAGDLPALNRVGHPFGVMATDISAGAFATALSRALRQPAAGFADDLKTHAAGFDLACISRRILDDLEGK